METNQPGNSEQSYQSFFKNKITEVESFYNGLIRENLVNEELRRYYYGYIANQLRAFIPLGQRVLDLGCGNGFFLNSVSPSVGVGIDISQEMVNLAQKRYPRLTFKKGSLEEIDLLEQKFDYILMLQVVGEVTELVSAFTHVHKFCNPRTRLVMVHYNYMWENLVKFAAILRLTYKPFCQNWIPATTFENILSLGGFELVRLSRRMLCPLKIPILGRLLNNFIAKLPLINLFCLFEFFYCRPVFPLQNVKNLKVSVVVPCKNEEGNIRQIIKRVPQMGKGTELIFVDDQSTDSTKVVIEREIVAHPQKTIKLVLGPGIGKGAAVRKGFSAAEGDIFMILDADMSVMPENLALFFDAIISGKGEFINGTRLIYPLGERAMRFLNILGNKVFSIVFSFLLDIEITDTLCGTKVLWRDDYQNVISCREYFGNVDHWGDYDWIFGAAMRGIKIIELPVHYVERTFGETKMKRRFRHGLVMLRMCYLAFRKIKFR